MAILPLAGMRVVDLADEKGELCGRALADLGAQVIRVEPSSGAVSRTLAPLADDGETSLYFATRNAGKRSVVLDIDTDAGRDRLHALLADADVMIESTQPGTLEKFGLSPAALLERYPGLIITSISDFGQDGPYRDYQGTSMIGFAMGGMMHRAGRFEKPPLVVPGNLAYDVAGITAAFATLLAFYKRLSTGTGQHLDLSTMEAVANLSDWSLPNYSLNPSIGPRAGAGIYTLYRCADGYMRMIVLVTKHWRALLEWVGSPEELMKPEYDQFINRLMNMDKIVPVLERFFENKKKVDVCREAQRLGVPATPLLTPSEVLENEHTIGRGTFKKLGVGGGLEARVPSGFITIDGERVGPVKPPPEVGELGDGDFSSAEDDDARASMRALLDAPPAPPEGGYPLSGLRVVDFGVGAVGVEVGRILGEYGADVIKIETRHAPDFIRVIVSSYMNPSFASSSRTKRSFGVNMKTERGRELVRKLVEQADVFIENNGTGVVDRLGLGTEDLAKINPRLVSFSSQMVGNFGPWKDWTGYGPNTHPVSGLQHLWNFPEDEDSPAGSTNVYPDHFVARVGLMAILAGLIDRKRTGKGCHTDAAQFETAISLLGDLYAQESLSSGSVRPQGNASSRGAPWGCYRCEGEDEWCVINVRSDAEWQKLRSAIGDPDWAQNPAYNGAAGRQADREKIDQALEQWTTGRDPRAAMETLQASGVPCGIVAHPGHHIGDPQLAFRNYPKLVDQQGLGSMLLEGPAFLGTDLPEVIEKQAPWLGEHTREVAAENLGLSAAEIQALVDQDILEDPPGEYKVG
jgi:crotonobetainyl-CoA:carnitine CoA-transferase CaiB-like acyl-CoA transferase